MIETYCFASHCIQEVTEDLKNMKQALFTIGLIEVYTEILCKGREQIKQFRADMRISGFGKVHTRSSLPLLTVSAHPVKIPSKVAKEAEIL